MDSNALEEAVARLERQCARAEYEYPKLAAPDGTVAVPFADLRILLSAVEERQVPTIDWPETGNVKMTHITLFTPDEEPCPVCAANDQGRYAVWNTSRYVRPLRTHGKE